jgi:hypothetical protein
MIRFVNYAGTLDVAFRIAIDHLVGRKEHLPIIDPVTWNTDKLMDVPHQMRASP